MKPFARLDRGFKSYLRKLIDTGHLNKISGYISVGVSEQLLKGGFESLSLKQVNVFFEHVIGKLIVDQCGVCKDDIRWSEMFAALNNGGHCKDCAYAFKEALKKKGAK